MNRIRKTIDITGVVQGVGFRPMIYHLARKTHLAGSVQNLAGTVRLVLEGSSSGIDKFLAALPGELPPNSRMDSVSVVDTEDVTREQAMLEFAIIESNEGVSTDLVIPADLAMCPDCAAEIITPGQRRYGYPFTTCTRCGPRYTVIDSTPYDRKRTTMSSFPLCDACRKEYENPSDRRFHAETIACPDCGPSLSLKNYEGEPVAGNPIAEARGALARGHVIAVRGIGGFLLAADATSRETLRNLRERKRRPHKPLAVMGRNIESLRQFVQITEQEEKLLQSAEAPIVIVDLKPGTIAGGTLPIELLAPDTGTLGVMLPTSPLHKLLFEPLEGDPTPPFELLVMTSGNRRSEPTSIGNEEARSHLRRIADFFLMHDREINLRNDDSLCVIQHGAPQIWRRARGYAPNALTVPVSFKRNVLAMGAEMKNAVALGYDNKVVLSPHVGDLETPEANEGMERVAEALPAFLNRTPEVVAVDLHPDMHSTILGKKIASRLSIPVVEVQHHHAHAAACLAEHGRESGLALVFDGTGLGTDGSIWGAELLHVMPGSFKRFATFAGAQLPGADKAVREPARQLLARWYQAGVRVNEKWLQRLVVSPDEAAVIAGQCREKVNCPVTHSAGRVFDSFAALFGYAPRFITYEGQPAVRLETAARRFKGTRAPDLPFVQVERDGMLVIDWGGTFKMFADDSVFAANESGWAMGLHRALAEAATAMVEFGVSQSPERTVALSGGVFMNKILNDLLIPMLEAKGLEVLVHRNVPPNDGCIAFGQAVVAAKSGAEAPST